MESLGKYLKKIREERGVSLEALSTRTRIRQNYLSALEEDRLDQVPNQVFAKGFVRSYLRAFSLDESEVLKRYEGEILSYFRHQEPFHQAPEPKPTENSERKPHKRVAVNIAVAVGIGLLGIWIFFPDRWSFNDHTESNQVPLKKVGFLPQTLDQPPSNVHENPLGGDLSFESRKNLDSQPNPLKRGASDRPAEKPLSPPSNVGVSNPSFSSSPAELKLNIKAWERSWVFVTIDNIQTKEMILEGGERYQMQAKEKFLITLGNSGGVSLELNNTPIDISGESGKVKRDILLTKETLQEVKTKENFGINDF